MKRQRMTTTQNLALGLTLGFTLAAGLLTGTVQAAEPTPVKVSSDLEISKASVSYRPDLDIVVFELEVRGEAGATLPVPAGQLDGAPVLGYVFPTTLKPEQVGFAPGEGILALATTSHPGFDDTPLWDEDGNGDPSNAVEGRVFHTHWVVLVKDDSVPGGLSVKAVTNDVNAELPHTAPDMPIYLDSPGFSVVLQGNRLRIPVPAWRVRDLGTFNYDAVTVYMQVNTSDESRPTLGVYKVYSVLSGDLSLPETFTLPAAAE